MYALRLSSAISGPFLAWYSVKSMHPLPPNLTRFSSENVAIILYFGSLVFETETKVEATIYCSRRKE
jgi:hypothetical protein